MKRISISLAAVAALSLASFATAGTQPLMGFDAFGNAVNSGWVASWNSAFDGQVDLTFRGMSGNQFFFEKDATLTAAAANGLDITFTKVDPNAKQLVINDEILRNQTGTDWTSFQWSLTPAAGGTAPGFAFTTSDGTSGIGDFRISPFTTFAFSNSNSALTFSGGTVANGQTWFAGASSATGIAIVAPSGSSSFTLQEQANQLGPGPVPIPLPAAMWTGLSTMLGLALAGGAARLRKVLA